MSEWCGDIAAAITHHQLLIDASFTHSIQFTAAGSKLNFFHWMICFHQQFFGGGSKLWNESYYNSKS